MGVLQEQGLLLVKQGAAVVRVPLAGELAVAIFDGEYVTAVNALVSSRFYCCNALSMGLLLKSVQNP